MRRSKIALIISMITFISMTAFKLPVIPSADFENQLNTLMAAFPSDFESLKGEKTFDKKDTAHVEWKSKVQLEGAAESYIAKNYSTDKHLSLIARMGNYEDKPIADNKYKELVEKVKACKFKCGEMTVTEGKDAVSQYTDWTLKFSTTPGPYAKLVLRVKLADHAYSETFHFYSLSIVIFEKKG